MHPPLPGTGDETPQLAPGFVALRLIPRNNAGQSRLHVRRHSVDQSWFELHSDRKQSDPSKCSLSNLRLWKMVEDMLVGLQEQSMSGSAPGWSGPFPG